MNSKQLRALAKVMKDYGITHVKTDALELSMPCIAAPATPVPTRAATIPPDAPAAGMEPISHKIEELTSLMKLDDVSLVDKLFPDHTEETQESA